MRCIGVRIALRRGRGAYHTGISPTEPAVTTARDLREDTTRAIAVPRVPSRQGVGLLGTQRSLGRVLGGSAKDLHEGDDDCGRRTAAGTSTTPPAARAPPRAGRRARARGGVPGDRVDDRRLRDPLTTSISTPQRAHGSGSTSNTSLGACASSRRASRLARARRRGGRCTLEGELGGKLGGVGKRISDRGILGGQRLAGLGQPPSRAVRVGHTIP